MSEEARALPKPAALVDLRDEISEAFSALRKACTTEDTLIIRITDVRDPHPPLTDKGALAVFTLRKLQALYHTATPQVATTPDVVIGNLAEIQRAMSELLPLIEDPGMNMAMQQFLQAATAAAQEVMQVCRNDPMQPMV